jgi:hypothetical protein
MLYLYTILIILSIIMVFGFYFILGSMWCNVVSYVVYVMVLLPYKNNKNK